MNTPHPRRPTLADVADVAGVSAKSVSRVVNGERHVSDGLRSRVMAAVLELGYRPDRRARTLASGPRSQLIGFVHFDVSNPFFAGVLRGVQDAVRTAGFMVVSGSTDGDPALETALIETLIEMRVDGLVVAAAEGDDALLRQEIQHGTTVVCVDRVSNTLDCDTVVSDNREGIGQAVAHLWGIGHRDIAFIGGNPAVWTASERHEGFKAAMTTHGRRHPSPEVLNVGDVDLADKAVRSLMSEGSPRPTALVTAQDRITIGAVRALQSLRIEDQIALIGYDDIPQADQIRPAIAVLAQDPHAMGQRAGDRLIQHITQTHKTAARRIVVPTQFRPRASAWITPNR